MLKLKLQYFGHLMRRADSCEKDPDAGKYWRREEKGMTEDEMVGWHHWLNGHELDQTLEHCEGQRSLACCSQRVGHDWATELKLKLNEGGGVFQLFGETCGDFQEMGLCPLFGLCWLTSELSWHLWVCHSDANVLQWAYSKTQCLLEVTSSSTLDLVGSNQFLSCPMAMSFF